MDKKWNLQDIKPAESKKAKAPASREETKKAPPKASRRPKSKQASSKRKFVSVFAIVAVLILGAGAIAAIFLDGATVTAQVRSNEVTINTSISAYKDAGEGELAYEVMTLEAEGERQVSADGEKEVSEQATGVIEIQNTLDSSERLITNTRFESPEGLIYKIRESVVVPAGTEDDPGTVQVEVYAAEPGEDYNIGQTEFTIPGYAEGGYDELYNSITARSVGEISGGFEGTTYSVPEDELETATNDLHDELKTALIERAKEERPGGFVLFEPSIRFSTETLPSEKTGEDQVIIKEKVTLRAPLFNEANLAQKVAELTVPGYEGNPVSIDDTSALTFAYPDQSATSTINLQTDNEIKFNLNGKPLLVWTFDEAKLKEDLSGSAKTALQTVLGGYPAIERAEVVIRPFWKQSFPDKPDNIVIEKNY